MTQLETKEGLHDREVGREEGHASEAPQASIECMGTWTVVGGKDKRC
jgi:hypothetical protein